MRIALAFALLALASPAGAQDRDGDHVADAVDLCPDAAERASTLFPGDGCPDSDGDHDGVVDDYDACPAAAETVNAYRDLDGCPDTRTAPPAVPPPPPVATRIGAWAGAGLFDVRPDATSTRLVPRADAPTWLGTLPLDCYAGLAFDGRRALHCTTADGTIEATLAFRIDGAHAIGFVAVRSSHGVDRRAWSSDSTPSAFDPQVSVVQVIREQHDALEACYAHELHDAPTLAGRIAVTMTVETSGEIDGVRVRSDTLSPARPAVGECLVRVIDAFVIAPAPTTGSVTYTFPFVFEPEPAP